MSNRERSILSIDTSMGMTSLALVCGDQSLITECDVERGHQAERLVLMVEALLKRAGVNYMQLDVVSVNRGPGSFSGIRIGMAAAAGFALACKKNPVGVSGLEALYHHSNYKGKRPCLVLIDAKRHHHYGQYFDVNGRGGVPLLLSDQDVLEYGTRQSVGLYGYMGEALCQLWRAEYGEAQLGEVGMLPNASMVLNMVKKQYICADVVPTPLYIRPPDAKPQKPVILNK